MWGCVRYLTQVSVLPAVGDSQLSRCAEKQRVAPTGRRTLDCCRPKPAVRVILTTSEIYIHSSVGQQPFYLAVHSLNRLPVHSAENVKNISYIYIFQGGDALLLVGATCCFSTKPESWRGIRTSYDFITGDLNYHMKQKMTRGETKWKVQCRVVRYSHA